MIDFKANKLLDSDSHLYQHPNFLFVFYFFFDFLFPESREPLSLTEICGSTPDQNSTATEIYN